MRGALGCWGVSGQTGGEGGSEQPRLPHTRLLQLDAVSHNLSAQGTGARAAGVSAETSALVLQRVGSCNTGVQGPVLSRPRGNPTEVSLGCSPLVFPDNVIVAFPLSYCSRKQRIGFILAWRTILVVASELCICLVCGCARSHARASHSALPVPAILGVDRGGRSGRPALDPLFPLAVEASLPATGEKQLLLSVRRDLMALPSRGTPCTITRCSLRVVRGRRQSWGSTEGRFFGSDGQDDTSPCRFPSSPSPSLAAGQERLGRAIFS